MSNKKFSEFTLQTDSSNVAFVVGFNGSDNVRISPSNLIGSGFLPVSGGTMTGNLLLQDNIQVQIGTSADLKLYHNGTDSFIENQTGILKIQSSVVDGDISFLADNGSGTATEYFRLDGGNTNVFFSENLVFKNNKELRWQDSGSTERTILELTNADDLYFGGSFSGSLIFVGGGSYTERFRIDDSGNVVFATDARFNDNIDIKLGSGNDCTLFHNGTDTFIDNGTGNLNIRNQQDDGDISFICDNGSGGVTEYFRLDGSSEINIFSKDTFFVDNVNLKVGSSGDLILVHDSSNSFIHNVTGNLTIKNSADDSDIVFESDDGSGSVTEYFRVDGGENRIVYSQDGRHLDNVKSMYGSGADLQISHNGTNTDINNFTGNLNILNAADDGDIIFYADDGSGGNAAYLTLDGSQGFTTAQKTIRFDDGAAAQFGGGADLRIHHNGTDSFITNHTGDLKIIQNTDDKDIIFQSDDGSGGVATYFACQGSGVETLFYKRARWADNVKAQFGGGADLEIYHDGTTNNIVSTNGNISIINQADDSDIKFFSDDGSGGVAEYFRVDGGDVRTIFSKEARFLDAAALKIGSSGDLALSHDGSNTRIENFTGALKIIQNTDDGDIEFFCDDGSGGIAEYFRVDGAEEQVRFFKPTEHGDGVLARFGNSGDLRIYHDGTDSFLLNNTGDLYLKNLADDKDINFQSDDGSGGFATYFRVDGSTVETRFLKATLHFDNVKAQFGDSGDLQIYHDGSNSYISDTGTGDFVLNTNGASIKLLFNNSEFMGQFVANGAARLYYDNSKKLETTSSGVDVTGRMAIDDGNNNVSIGDFAGDALTSGSFNVALGTFALSTEDTGGRSTAIGYGTLTNQNYDGSAYNIAVGYNAGNDITTGDENTIIGGLAGDTLTTGSRNTVLGMNALSTEDTGGRNTAIGWYALHAQDTGSDAYNTAVGYFAGGSISTGVNNTIIGGFAGDALTTGTGNTTLGYQSLSAEDTLDGNTAIGYQSLKVQDGGSFNTSLGYQSGVSVSTGDENTFIGAKAGDAVTTGSNLTVIGFNAAASAVGAADEITLGDSNVDTLRCATQTISALSDKRDKTNIQESTYGLDFINQLNPVTFDWNTRDGSRKGKKDLGFIAQELDAVDDEYTQLVYKSNPDKLEASYGRLVPVLVKAIQELKAEIQELKNK